MVSQPPAGLPALAQLYVYVTDACNCSCIHCWIVSEKAGAINFLPPEVLEAAIQEALPLGLNALKWTGGEPTIHPEFPRLLAIQKEHALEGRMETNGLRLTPALAGLLKDSGVTHISVSLDGAHAETHDAIRGVRGAYEKALAGIGFLVEAGYHPQIIMSLVRRNVSELEEMLALSARVGAGSVKFNLVQPSLRGEVLHEAGGALPVAELITLYQRVQHELRPRFGFRIYFDIPLAFLPLSSLLANGASTCGIKNILGLLADGSYALCGIGVNLPEMVFGRADQGQLAQIWGYNEVLVKIRTALPSGLTGICGSCLMKAECLGSCVAQNYHDTGDLTADFWFCRAAFAEGLFPGSRQV
jgi:SynChlorMet cassette radical SAM/SPASM protein ScmF